MYIKFGHPIYGMAINEEWCEVDTARDFIIANELYKKGKFNYNK